VWRSAPQLGPEVGVLDNVGVAVDLGWIGVGRSSRCAVGGMAESSRAALMGLSRLVVQNTMGGTMVEDEILRLASLGGCRGEQRIRDGRQGRLATSRSSCAHERSTNLCLSLSLSSTFSLSVFYALSVPLLQTTGSMSGSSKATKECPSCHKQFSVRGLSSHQKKCELQTRLNQEDQRRSQQIYTRLCIPGVLNSLSIVSKITDIIFLHLKEPSRTRKSPSPSQTPGTSDRQLSLSPLSEHVPIDMQIDDLSSQSGAIAPLALGVY